ncbi:MAG: nucleotidyltransferase family protein [Planctomycetes bacterium]|nr:nucleotidyltransferase family protein [Planctomycetota bacterium]
MIAPFPIEVPDEKLGEFCRRNHIRRLSFFGSVVRDDFGPESDIDVLVEFAPDHIPGFFRFIRMERELTEMFGGRKVDLNTLGFFGPVQREKINDAAVVHYDAQR